MKKEIAMKTIDLTIEGMSCGHCVMAVKKELSKLNGLTVESVEVGKARIQIDEAAVPLERIAKAVEEAGYRLTR
jgi:copper chaperone